jgi:hypothetical protein
MLFGLAMLGKSQESVLAPYEPIQAVRPTNKMDTESYYDTYLQMFRDRPITNKPYMLVTSSEEQESFGSDPTYIIVDYGTYHEIDSLKCVRYKQMQWKLYHLDKLNEKSCK